MPDKKEVYIVGGPNGAGKTTFVKKFLPKYVNVRNFVNADDIAHGLSPLDAASINITSGKLMLKMIDKYRNRGESFGFETTLAGSKWMKMIQELKSAGYMLYIFFLDLASAELAVSRVKYRVETGGHDIPEETIRRRYLRSRRNFWYNYRNGVDSWYLFDNSTKVPKLVANYIGKEIKVIDLKYLRYFEETLGEG